MTLVVKQELSQRDGLGDLSERSPKLRPAEVDPGSPRAPLWRISTAGRAGRGKNGPSAGAQRLQKKQRKRCREDGIEVGVSIYGLRWSMTRADGEMKWSMTVGSSSSTKSESTNSVANGASISRAAAAGVGGAPDVGC